jgi:hypothetical protein
MTSREASKKTSADFFNARNASMVRQSQQRKLNVPRIEPQTSAKAANEVAADGSETDPESGKNPNVDAEQTTRAVMEAISTVGEEISSHLSKEDKQFIRKTCLKDDMDYNTIFYAAIALLLGFLTGSYLKNSKKTNRERLVEDVVGFG